MLRALVFDTETTALLRPDCARLELQPHIVEMAWQVLILDGS